MKSLSLALWLFPILPVLAAHSAPPDPVSPDAPAYSPQFTDTRAADGAQSWWILDHGSKIAVCGKGGIDLRVQYPRQPNLDPEIYKNKSTGYFSDRGLHVTTILGGYAKNDILKVTPVFAIDASAPLRYKMHVTWKLSDKDHADQEFVLNYDSALRRYVVLVTCDMVSSVPREAEFNDMYTWGMGDLRPGLNKYDHVIWLDAKNIYRKHYLNVVTPGVASWGNNDFRRWWELSDLAAVPFLGVFNEPAGNPVIVWEESTPVYIAVCPAWFDMHIRWKSNVPVSAGAYVYHTKYKAYWMNSQESAKIEAVAQTMIPKPSTFKNWVPFSMGKTNDFETRIDVKKPPYKYEYIKLNANIQYVDDMAHSGKHAILFTNTDAATTVRTSSQGPEIMPTPGKLLKVSAWVKSENVTGEGFWIQTKIKGPKTSPLYQTEKVKGTGDWKKIEIPFDPTPDTKGVMMLDNRLTFMLAGTGKVWLDDLEFCEVNPPAGTETAPRGNQP